MKIAEELSSIRNELSSLKKEFAVIKSEDQGSASKANKEEVKEDQQGGFFTEEDDEKIALTGDELDNILNTADFTEETGATEKLESEFAFTGNSEPSPVPAEDKSLSLSAFDEVSLDDEINLSDETGAQDESIAGIEALDTSSLDTAALENVMEEAPAAFDELESLDVEALDEDFAELGTPSDNNGTGDEDLIEIDLDDLGINLDPDAVPMTPAPEDTSYLEEDTIAQIPEDDFAFDVSLEDNNSFDSTSLDLSEAVIDEPDLSSGIVENPVVEPILEEIDDTEFDISALEELSDAGAKEEDIAVSGETKVDSLDIDNNDININLSKNDDSIVQVIPEGFHAEIEEAPVSFDDLDIDIPVESAKTTDVARKAEKSETPAVSGADDISSIPSVLKVELKNVLSYLDQLLEALPEDKIEEFAKSEHFDAYKKIFKELGLA